MSVPDSSNVTVNRADLAQVITSSSQNNYGKVGALKYFCGGDLKDESNPSVVCEVNVNTWLDDIEARTAENWTDAGRIQLSKQYSIGAPYEIICTVIRDKGEDWAEIKAFLRRTFPDRLSFGERKLQAMTTTRKCRETLSVFYSRIYRTYSLLIQERPDLTQSLNEEFALVLTACMPKSFNTYLKDTDKDKPHVVFEKALKFAKDHPQAGLLDVDVKKETQQKTQVVGAVSDHTGAVSPYSSLSYQPTNIAWTNTPPSAYNTPKPPSFPPRFPPPSHTPRQPNNYTSQRHTDTLKCFRCNKMGHIAKNCRAPFCPNCNGIGHMVAHCPSRQGNIQRSHHQGNNSQGRSSQGQNARGRFRHFQKNRPQNNFR